MIWEFGDWKLKTKSSSYMERNNLMHGSMYLLLTDVTKKK